MSEKIDAYNEFAPQYEKMITNLENAGIERDRIMPAFLEVLGDVHGLVTLDAGCGTGYLSRILALRGAEVTGIDIAANLVEIAQAKDPERTITYQVADLSQPLLEYEKHFDLIVSRFVLNDVYDYRGFLRTLGSVTKTGGRVVIAMNNPYSFVIRGHITDYFDSGKKCSYRGLAEEGVKVYFYQRTLQEYLDACFAAGLQLQRLIDIPTPEGSFKRRNDTLIPVGYSFPFFMIMSFVKS